MLTGTQPTFGMSSKPSSLPLDPILLNETLSKPQPFKRFEPIHIQDQIPLSVPTASIAYSESAYQWLTEVLDGLIDFGKRHGHYGVIKLTKDEYQWLDDVLEELIYSVGEDESHPLGPLMDFIILLIANYEDVYVPKLSERFPELAEETPIYTVIEKEQTVTNTPKPSDIKLAARAFFSIGLLLSHGNRTEKVISAYDTAIVLKPDFWEASYNLGIARYDIRQYTKAMVNFNKAIELNHNFASAYYNRGILKSELKDYEGAIADFNETITLKPDHIEAHNNRGIAKSKLDRHESAIADFDKAITLGFNCAEVYCHRASANALLGEYDAAVSDYDKVIELKPDFVEVYNIRGILRSELGQHDEALADYTEAIRIKPDYAEAYAYRGILKAHLGRINKAREDFQTALELAEQQNCADLKSLVENQLEQLKQQA